MKIVKFEVSNVQRIRTAAIEPDRSVTKVGGMNGQGKSTLLNCFKYLFAGGKTIASQALRRGEKKGFIRATEEDGVTTTRSFTPGGSSLEVKDPEGHIIPQPQAVCDAKTGGMWFDPMAFFRMKPSEHVEVLKQITGLDFSEMDKERARMYDDRTEFSREAKRLQTILDDRPVHEGLPEKPVDSGEITGRIQAAEQISRDLQALTSKVETAQNESDRLRVDAARKIEDARLAKLLADNMAKEYAQWKTELADHVEPEDTAALYAMIEEAATTNRQIEENAERAKIEEQLAARTAEAETATSEMAAIDAKKEEMIAGVKMPIDGLEFGDGGLLYNGVPLDEDHASSSELIRISTAIGFEQHPDPEKLQIMLIQDCSLLDEENLKMLCDMAEEYGVQCLLEVVGDDADIIMVDGLVSGEIKVD